MADDGKVICDRCGNEYVFALLGKCPFCKSSRIRPKFVKEKEKVLDNWRFYVSLVESKNDPTKFNIDIARLKPISDEEWGYHSIRLRSPEELLAVNTLTNKFAKKAGWKNLEEHIIDITEKTKEGVQIDSELAKLIQQHPRIVPEILKKIDWESIDEGSLEYLNNLIKILQSTIFGAEDRVKTSFLTLMSKLTNENRKGFDELSDLLESWNLLQITAVSHILLNRLNTLDMMGKLIFDDKAYELKGDKSIHRILENNMWMIDETYWLAQSNETIRKFIGDEVVKKTKDANKRPDFVCSQFNDTIIIVEIKRPSKTVDKKDLDQIESYDYIINKYKGKRFKLKLIIVGNKFSNEAKYLLNRRKNINRMSYSDLIEESKKKYQQYLKEIEEKKSRL